MPTFPDAWPPRPASGRRSIRFFAEGTTTGAWADNAVMFRDGGGANTIRPTPYQKPGQQVGALGNREAGGSPMGGRQIPQDAIVGNKLTPPQGAETPPDPMLWAQTLAVSNDGTTGDTLEITFDGTNIHGKVLNGETRYYRNRFEAGIAVRLSGTAASGTITTIAVALLIDGETFVLDDGTNPAVTFEFDDNGSVVETNTLRQVDISGITTADEVRDACIAAINDAPVLNIEASDGGAATVGLVGPAGTAANVAITDTVANAGFTHTGMTGGTGAAFAFRIEAW